MGPACPRSANLIGLFLLAAMLSALPIPVAAAGSPPSVGIPADLSLNLTAINGSLLMTFTPTLAPVTLLHLELNQASLPGERYMAFGPGVIEVSASPFALAFLGLIPGGAAAAWFLFPGRNGNG
jgi:hypothetical protein